jgi:ATP-dependent Zn protease
VAKVLGDESSRTVVEDLLDHAHEEARRILVAHRHIAHALRDALLERDELVGDEILAVIAAADASLIDLTSDLA